MKNRNIEIVNKHGEAEFYQFESFQLQSHLMDVEIDLDVNYKYMKGFAFIGSGYSNQAIVGLKQDNYWIQDPIPFLFAKNTRIEPIKAKAQGAKITVSFDFSRVAIADITTIKVNCCFLLTNKRPEFENRKLDFFLGTHLLQAAGDYEERFYINNKARRIKQLWYMNLMKTTNSYGTMISNIQNSNLMLNIYDQQRYYLRNFKDTFSKINSDQSDISFVSGLPIEIPKSILFIKNTVETNQTYEHITQIIYEYE